VVHVQVHPQIYRLRLLPHQLSKLRRQPRPHCNRLVRHQPIRPITAPPLVLSPCLSPFVSCFIGVIFGLYAFGLIIAVIVFCLRQKKRMVCLGALFLISRLNTSQAWYGQMAAHYQNGGPPPWVASTVGVGDKAPLSPISSPTQGSYPKAQFGEYGNLPTVPYTNATDVTDVTDYTGTPSLSPQPQHSQYSNTASSSEPNNAAPTVRHSIVYARPLSTPTQTDQPTSSIHGIPAHHGGVIANAQTCATQTSLLSPTHGAHSFYGGGQINAVTYNSAPEKI